jgi:hypothetical protein
MIDKHKIKELLNEKYGNFTTLLEKQYEYKLTNKLISGNKTKWITYNQVVLELKHSLKDTLKVKELQYKLTENDDSTNNCLSVIEDIKTSTPELERLYYKIKNFQNGKAEN